VGFEPRSCPGPRIDTLLDSELTTTYNGPVGALVKLSEWAGMSPPRVSIAILLCGLIGCGQLIQTALKRDDWPLSRYPMYSSRQSPKVTTFSLVGVTANGEVELPSSHTAPLSRRRVNRLLHASADTPEAVVGSLVPSVCRNLTRLGEPEISAIRIFKTSFRIDPKLEGMDNQGKLHAVVPLLCPNQRERIRAQKATFPTAIAAPPGSVVLEAENLELRGLAHRVNDVQASRGKSVSLSGFDAPVNASVSPPSSIVAHFDAQAGKYYVWLRSKASKDANQQSVWLQVNNTVGTAQGIELSDLATPSPHYPADAYAWTSQKAGYDPATIEFSDSGDQTLVIYPWLGAPVVDQVVLTPTWAQHPVHNLPVRL
jgi:hypothetical protein